ncbi:MAG: murein hydrolase activator EnvC family protein [Actinomycetota bacterium]
MAKRIGICFLIIAGLIAPLSAPATASSRSSRWNEIQRQMDQTRANISRARNEEQGIISQIAASDVRAQRLQSALGSLNVQLGAAEVRLNAMELAQGRAQITIDQRTNDLASAMTLLDQQQKILDARAVQRYMDGPATFAPVLLNATDFSSFIAADQYVASALRADVSAIDQVKGLRDQIAQERSALDQQKQAIDEQVMTLQMQRDAIAAIQQRQAYARSQIVSEINYRKQLLSKVQNQEQAWQDVLASMQRESDSITGILQGFEVGESVIAGAGHGYLVWPVSGIITSPFGWRIHPIFHRRSFHTGIDIGAPYGTPIGAARSGVVVYTGYRGAYGLMVIVDHGNSVATVYAHMSSVAVSPGQHVSTRETLGNVGCTGWCTGPHVHFEVRVSGVPTNPVRWL